VSEWIALALLENTTQNGDLVHWTQSELAAEVGTTREVVARCLAGLQTSGAVRLGRGRVTVLNRDKLLSEIR
jgi:CRP/FNR family transcriptional regulator